MATETETIIESTRRHLDDSVIESLLIAHKTASNAYSESVTLIILAIVARVEELDRSEQPWKPK